jgi:hypothetical protein
MPHRNAISKPWAQHLAEKQCWGVCFSIVDTADNHNVTTVYFS